MNNFNRKHQSNKQFQNDSIDFISENSSNQNNQITNLRKWNSTTLLSNESETSRQNTNKVRPSSTFEALSLEQNLIWQRGSIRESFTLTSFHITDASVQVVTEVLEDILDYVVQTGERRRREQIVEKYLERAIPAPQQFKSYFVSTQEVQTLSHGLQTASVSLQSSSVRLQAAWKLILVTTAQQLCVSFRRILDRYDNLLQKQLEEQGMEQRSLLTDASQGLLIRLIKERCKIYVKHKNKNRRKISIDRSSSDMIELDAVKVAKDSLDAEVAEQEFERVLVQYFDHQDEENYERRESDELLQHISSEAYNDLQHATDTILSLAVEYLKNATSNVVEDATQDIKHIVYSHL